MTRFREVLNEGDCPQTVEILMVQRLSNAILFIFFLLTHLNKGLRLLFVLNGTFMINSNTGAGPDDHNNFSRLMIEIL
jgi:hypothetical protein